MRRVLLIRRVTTRPSVRQSKAAVPPSWPDMLRATSPLPKPAGPAGATTGGPPRSVQTSATSAPWAGHDTSSLPLAAESAPYLIELVASSWTTRASVVIAASPTRTSGTETLMRSPTAPAAS